MTRTALSAADPDDLRNLGRRIGVPPETIRSVLAAREVAEAVNRIIRQPGLDAARAWREQQRGVVEAVERLQRMVGPHGVPPSTALGALVAAARPPIRQWGALVDASFGASVLPDAPEVTAAAREFYDTVAAVDAVEPPLGAGAESWLARLPLVTQARLLILALAVLYAVEDRFGSDVPPAVLGGAEVLFATFWFLLELMNARSAGGDGKG